MTPASRALDPVAQPHPLRSREGELLEPEGERGPEGVDTETSAAEQRHVPGAHLQRHHLLVVTRAVAQERVEQRRAALRRRVHAAQHEPVTGLAAERDEAVDPRKSAADSRDTARKPDG